MYNRCNSASDDYSELAHHVQILQTVSGEVQAFAKDDGLPKDQQRITSLVLAGKTCLMALTEVEGVLNKHTGLAASKKRWFDVIKFVRRDVDALKSKLNHATELMQLALMSLTR